MQPERPVRLLIVDDHELVRDGIRARLESEKELEIIGEAENGRQAVALVEQLQPDLVMLDINMPEMNGLDAVEEIRSRDLPCNILMLSLYDNSEYVRRAMDLGTNGYLLKDVSQSEMAKAIKIAAGGGFYISESLALSLGDLGETNDPYNLTDREREILVAIASGKLNKQIAGELDISVRTVESHRSAIRHKTGGGNAAGLTRIAAELGLT
ncbi:MAG: response regulator [Rhizobiaceae bacterium]|nr:response regulator [Rhizobiaceae bacterium]